MHKSIHKSSCPAIRINSAVQRVRGGPHRLPFQSSHLRARYLFPELTINLDHHSLHERSILPKATHLNLLEFLFFEYCLSCLITSASPHHAAAGPLATSSATSHTFVPEIAVRPTRPRTLMLYDTGRVNPIKVSSIMSVSAL